MRTIAAIYPSITLLESAASHISRFVASENHNLKYLGIKALASIVGVNQKCAPGHQMVSCPLLPVAAHYCPLLPRYCP